MAIDVAQGVCPLGGGSSIVRSGGYKALIID